MLIRGVGREQKNTLLEATPTMLTGVKIFNSWRINMIHTLK